MHSLLTELCKAHVPTAVVLPADGMFLEQQPIPIDCRSTITLKADLGKLSSSSSGTGNSLLKKRMEKVAAMQMCPFKKTLYLDNDICVHNATRLLGWFEKNGECEHLCAVGTNRCAKRARD
jgi:hypothetical protein